MPHSPLSRYQQLIDQCELREDSAQRALIEQLDTCYHQIIARSESETSRSGQSFLTRLMSRIGGEENTEDSQVKGLYLWGGVGRGKSMLMDLFYDCLPEHINAKRVHFHQFISNMHARIHSARRDDINDPLRHVAQEVAQTHRVLCFDELQVHDITDAMILGRLFEVLFHAGVIVIFTSNRLPEDLYKHGLQREQFLPFIALVRRYMDVVEIKSDTDYRQHCMTSMDSRYLHPCTTETHAALQHNFEQMIHHALAKPQTLHVQSRELHVPKAYGDVAWFHFNDLCAQPLGTGDYAEIATVFRVVFICNIPQLTPDERNEAKRFVHLIDILYEAHCVLCCTAEAAPEALYDAGDGAFEFERTASRLREMMSDEYLARHAE